MKLHNPTDRKNHLTVVFGHKFQTICVLLMFSCARITSANLRNHTYFSQLHCKCTRHFLLHCFCHSRTKNTYTNIPLLFALLEALVLKRSTFLITSNQVSSCLFSYHKWYQVFLIWLLFFPERKWCNCLKIFKKHLVAFYLVDI